MTNKPREFYIQIFADPNDINKPYRRYVSANYFSGVGKNDEDWPNAEIVHVIEYSAFDRLKEEINRCEEQNFRLRQMCELELVKQLKKDYQALLEQAEKMAEALKYYSNRKNWTGVSHNPQFINNCAADAGFKASETLKQYEDFKK